MIAIRFRSVTDAAEAVDRLQHEPGVAFEQRVDERQLAAVVDQERVHVPALAVAEAVDAGGELGHEPTVFQGANGLATPSSDGSSCGKCRSRTERMSFDSTQSIPVCV